MNELITPPGMGTPVAQKPSATMNIKPSELDDVTCDECGNFTFQQVVLMKRMPALISPTGKEAFVPMQVFSCNSCGHVNERFIQGMGAWFKDAVQPETSKDDKTIEGSKLPGLHVVTPEPAQLVTDEGAPDSRAATDDK